MTDTIPVNDGSPEFRDLMNILLAIVMEKGGILKLKQDVVAANPKGLLRIVKDEIRNEVVLTFVPDHLLPSQMAPPPKNRLITPGG